MYFASVQVDPAAAILITSVGDVGECAVIVDGELKSYHGVNCYGGSITSLVPMFQPILVRPGQVLEIEYLTRCTLQGFILNANEILP